MVTTTANTTAGEIIRIDLRESGWAAFLAWLWPGAGHLYQRRYAKGALFMVSILAIYCFGLFIGEGHVVYASWTKEDRRWHYACQLGVGLPALPALIQANRVLSQGKSPHWGGFMAPPRDVRQDSEDELAQWHARLGGGFELGTLYTMIAGLLNILVIFDALVGPCPVPEEKEKPTKDAAAKEADAK